MKTLNTRSIATAQAIADRADFKTYGALRGAWDTSVSYGILPSEWAKTLDSDRRASDGGRVYVVYSYSTPIAWFTDANGWRVPTVKYSVTTTRHQGNLYKVGRAW